MPESVYSARDLYESIRYYLDRRRIWYNPVPRGLIAVPAVWRPHLDPPRLLYWDDLNDCEGALAFAHELGHVLLHPPGSPDPGAAHENESEERIVHGAAAALWAHCGLTGYEEGMTVLGVPSEMLNLHDDERQPASSLSQEMINSLLS
jgi:hypothetical protein